MADYKFRSRQDWLQGFVAGAKVNGAKAPYYDEADFVKVSFKISSSVGVAEFEMCTELVRPDRAGFVVDWRCIEVYWKERGPFQWVVPVEEQFEKIGKGKIYQGFCTLCSTLIERFDGLAACPNCGTAGVPCSFINQVTVVLNSHELRLILIWAENHATWMKRNNPHDDPFNKEGIDVVYAIAARLRRQLKAGSTLTMHDEFLEIQKRFPNAGTQTNHPAADSPEFPPGMYKPDQGP